MNEQAKNLSCLHVDMALLAKLMGLVGHLFFLSCSKHLLVCTMQVTRSGIIENSYTVRAGKWNTRQGFELVAQPTAPSSGILESRQGRPTENEDAGLPTRRCAMTCVRPFGNHQQMIS